MEADLLLARFIGAFQLFSVLFCAVGAGRAFDFGKLRWIMAAATLIYAAGLFGLANSTTYAEIFLAQGFACGVGAGLAFLPAVCTAPLSSLLSFRTDVLWQRVFRTGSAEDGPSRSASWLPGRASAALSIRS